MKKISFTGIISGIILLFFLIPAIDLDNTEIGDIKNVRMGSSVNITGYIEDIDYIKGHIFMYIGDGSESIKAVLWNNTITQTKDSEKLLNKLNKGSMVNIIGVIDRYEGEIEVIIKKDGIKVYER